MGQLWTTAHTLACKDTKGQRTSVFHQVASANEAGIVPERFVLGNGEILISKSGIFFRANGEEISANSVSLP